MRLVELRVRNVGTLGTSTRLRPDVAHTHTVAARFGREGITNDRAQGDLVEAAGLQANRLRMLGADAVHVCSVREADAMSPHEAFVEAVRQMQRCVRAKDMSAPLHIGLLSRQAAEAFADAECNEYCINSSLVLTNGDPHEIVCKPTILKEIFGE